MSGSDLQSRLQNAQHLLAGGKFSAAAEAYQLLLDAQEDKTSPTRILALDGLGRSWHALGQMQNAEAAFEQSLLLLESTFGPDHPHVALGLQNLSRLLAHRHALGEAQELAERAVAILLSTVGAQHPKLADALLNLSSIQYKLGNYDKAEARLQQAQSIWEEVVGNESMEVSTCLNNLGRIMELRGLPRQGAEMHRQAAEIRLRLLGDHPETAQALGNLGTALASDKQWDNARKALEAAVACYEKVGMDCEPETMTCRANLQLCLAASGG